MRRALSTFALIVFGIFFALPLQAHSIKDLVRELVKEGWSQEYINSIFTHTNFNQPGSPTTRACRKARQSLSENVSKESIQAGIRYYKKHKKILEKVRRIYGVPIEYILSTLRRETEFGVCLGDHYALRKLVQVYINTHRKKRRSFVVRQLLSLFDIAKEYNWTTEKLLNLPGSRMGALGQAQFIPESIPLYGVDGNKDGVVDLFNPHDVIHSIANYYQKRGQWGKKTVRESVLRYNSSGSYANKVIEYADAIRPYIQ